MKNRSLLLTFISVALGVLVWLDNRPANGPEGPVSAQVHPSEVDSESADERAHSMELEGSSNDEATSQKQASNPLAVLNRELFENMVERPLFASSRKRPPPATKDPSQVDVKAPPSYELMGVVLNGARAIALLRNPAEGSSFRVQAGDMIGGWRVSKVEAKSVLIEREDGMSETLQLQRE